MQPDSSAHGLTVSGTVDTAWESPTLRLRTGSADSAEPIGTRGVAAVCHDGGNAARRDAVAGAFDEIMGTVLHSINPGVHCFP